MAEKVPSIEESLADPTVPKTGNRLVKNLHIIIPGVLVGMLSLVLFAEAVKQDQQTEPQTLADLAAREISTTSNLQSPGAQSDITAELDRQRSLPVEAPAIELPTRPSLPPSLASSRPAVDGLPPVPRSEPTSADDLAAARETAKREEAIRSATLMALTGGARTGANSPGGPINAGSPGLQDVRAQLEQQNAKAAQMREELMRNARGGAGAGAHGGPTFARTGAAQSGTDRNGEWMSRVGAASTDSRDVIRLDSPGPRPVIHQGVIIPAVLVSELNSDLPGQLSAMVTMDVYDSIRGDQMLIPKGSKLVGTYNNQLATGQERVMAAFTRIIRPDGSSIDLRAMPAADAIGQSGLSDEVDNHFFKMFSSSFLVAGLAWIFERNQPSTVVVAGNGSGKDLGSEAGQILVDVSRSILDRNKTIPPTLIIRKGHKFNVVVNRDMAITPYP